MTGTNDEAAFPSDMATPVRVSYGNRTISGVHVSPATTAAVLNAHYRSKPPHTNKIVPCSVQGVSMATKLNEQLKHQIWILQSILNRPLFNRGSCPNHVTIYRHLKYGHLYPHFRCAISGRL